MSLYHYTDANGLLGILNNNSLWATHIHFLNDIKELHSGVERLNLFLEQEKKMVNELITDNELLDLHPALRFLCTSYDQTINDLNFLLNEKIDIYIISFTDKKDNLRQWMSYCPPNGGYCIEFNEEVFDNMTNLLSNNIMSKLMPVSYEGINCENYLSIKNVLSDIFKQKGDIDSLKNYIIDRNKNILFDCCSSKENMFQDESEKRIIIQASKQNNSIKHRTKSGVIIPYIEYIFNPSCIKSIWIGPNLNKELARAGIEKLLKTKNITCKIEESICSLRSY